MITDPPPFRLAQPLAWTFHQGTARWSFTATSAANPPPRAGREHPDASWTPLPAPAVPPVPLPALLADRVSCRRFAPDALPLAGLATLLHAAYGVLGRTVDDGIDMLDRPAPSAGGLYPLEVSVLVRAVAELRPGVHHYVPLAGGLEQLRDHLLPAGMLTYLFMGQPWVAQAAAVLVLSAVPARSLDKYGDRGYRYLLLETGHVAQNIALAAGALGLGALAVGGFHDDELARLLAVDPEHEVPLLAVAVGAPAVARPARRGLPQPGLT